MEARTEAKAPPTMTVRALGLTSWEISALDAAACALAAEASFAAAGAA